MNIQFVFNETDNYKKLLYRIIYNKYNIKNISDVKNECMVLLLDDYIEINDKIINHLNEIKFNEIYLDGENDIFLTIKNEPKFVLFPSKYLNQLNSKNNEEIINFFKNEKNNSINLNYELINIKTIHKDDIKDLLKYYISYTNNYNQFLLTLKYTNIDVYNFLIKYLLNDTPICIMLQVKELKDYFMIKKLSGRNIRSLLWIEDKELYEIIFNNIKADKKVTNKIILIDNKYNKAREQYSMTVLYHNEIIIKQLDKTLLTKININNIRQLHEKNNLIVQNNYVSYYRKSYEFLPNYLFYNNYNEIITDFNNNKDIQYLISKTKNKLVDPNFKIIYNFEIPEQKLILTKATLYMTEKRYDEGNELIDNYIENTSSSKINFQIITCKLSFSAITKNIKNLDIYLNVMKNIITNDTNEIKDVLKKFFDQLLSLIFLIDIDRSKLKNFYITYLKFSDIPKFILDVYKLLYCYINDISHDESKEILDCFKDHYKKYAKEFLLSNDFKKLLSIMFKQLQRNDDYENINKLIDILNDATSLINIKDETKMDIYFKYFKDYCPELIYNISSQIDPYFQTQEEIENHRNKALVSINKLIKIYKNNNVKVYLKDITGFYTNNFYFSYHGLSSCEYFKKKCEFFRMICPELNYKASYIPNKNNKIKVAFISDFLIRMHSVFKDRHQIIKKLSEDNRFDVYLITINDLEKEQQKIFTKTKHIKIEQNLENAKNTIEKLNLDYLVYCEIGMNPFFYHLAFLKLARIQLNTWGHSDTSGIDSIDYFMSSKLYEIDNAQENYSENLVKLNSLCTCYVNPISKYKINDFKDRYYYGFSNTCKIYICPQSIFKLLPEYDEYLLDILEKDPTSIIILQDAVTGKKDKIIKRLEKYNKNLGRLHFIGGVPHFIYLNYIYISDVMLDPFPFGGCNSSLEAFSMGIPVITQPSNMINGRFTSGFYKKMNILDLICNSKDEYVDKAIKVANNKDFKDNIVNKIKENNKVLYNDEESFTEWRDFFIQNN